MTHDQGDWSCAEVLVRVDGVPVYCMASLVSSLWIHTSKKFICLLSLWSVGNYIFGGMLLMCL